MATDGILTDLQGEYLAEATHAAIKERKIDFLYSDGKAKATVLVLVIENLYIKAAFSQPSGNVIMVGTARFLTLALISFIASVKHKGIWCKYPSSQELFELNSLEP